ncbi:hypothetical protein C5167_049052 [Papaver somniferum]|uniref:Uncharacterized protein n=1 Tax=Papaver somniferum TaxID=3469 RepID=A0A4Y7KMF2_PAPSO|nr:hypothetical protein C5167_049052 [Papaver somniferum]
MDEVDSSLELTDFPHSNASNNINGGQKRSTADDRRDATTENGYSKENPSSIFFSLKNDAEKLEYVCLLPKTAINGDCSMVQKPLSVIEGNTVVDIASENLKE